MLLRRGTSSAQILLRRAAQQHPHAITAPSRRFLSGSSNVGYTGRRSWKSSAVRWGLVFGAVYYYNTSNLFAEEPAYLHRPPESPYESESASLPSIDTITQQRRERARATEAPTSSSHSSQQTISSQGSAADSKTASVASPPPAVKAGEEGEAAMEGVEGLEEEADQQGAFNPETGEINWDCPCLGGMAHGPCGDEFKAAFSCFIYSKEEPKGVDCIDRFKGMQDCFRQHPEIYGAEFDEEEGDENLEGPDDAPKPALQDSAASESPVSSTGSTSSTIPSPQHERAEKVADQTVDKRPDPNEVKARRERAEAATKQVHDQHGPEPTSESDDAVPKAWHDTRSSGQ